MIRISIIFGFVFFISCGKNKIPEKVHLGDEPREIAGAYCECMMQHDKNVAFCFKEIKGILKKALERNSGNNRKAFIKNVLHALIETECFDESLNMEQLEELSF
ncbi:MAG: hypothetical protein R2799_02070 [Crocinitomicaceae bacterium]